MTKSHDKDLEQLLVLWRASGRTAAVYPRKVRVCLNGGRPMRYRDAKERICAILQLSQVM